MANDNTLLRIAFHIDDGTDMNIFLGLLETLHAHLHTVRYLLVIIKEYLFADYLTDEEACWLICQLIIDEIRRTIG